MGKEWFTHGTEYDFDRRILRKGTTGEARHRWEGNNKTNLKKIGWNSMERFHMIRDMKKKMMGTCGSKSTLPGV
jgi:hypothetical protein